MDLPTLERNLEYFGKSFVKSTVIIHKPESLFAFGEAFMPNDISRKAVGE